MITDRTTYQRLDASDNEKKLRRMTAEESIAIGEAILTSEVMLLADFPSDDHPQSLAIAIGIPSIQRIARSMAPLHRSSG